MTHEDAIKTLERTQDLYFRALKESEYAEEQVAIINHDMNTVMEAIAKQIPRPPLDAHPYASLKKCPGCMTVISPRSSSKYCQYCGQALDWERK